MELRFAFTAQYWGNGAVVCRAIEDQPGPVVEQQFGEFPTWTQALSCATKLNEGLDLDFLEVRRIVTSSLLATACVLQESLNCRRLWSAAQLETRAAQLRFVMSELTLALTFCRSLPSLSDLPAHRVLLNAKTALQHASLFLGFYDADDREMQEFASLTRALDAALQSLAPSFQPSFQPSSPPSKGECWPGDIYRSEELRRKAIRRKSECVALLSSYRCFLSSLNPDL